VPAGLGTNCAAAFVSAGGVSDVILAGVAFTLLYLEANTAQSDGEDLEGSSRDS
jgi:hypothetical protein